MNEEIEVLKLHIIMPRDPSVGLFPVCWTLEPELIFQDKETFENFKDDILIAFENAFDEHVYVETQKEIDEREKEFEEAARESFNNITDDDYLEPLKPEDE